MDKPGWGRVCMNTPIWDRMGLVPIPAPDWGWVLVIRRLFTAGVTVALLGAGAALTFGAPAGATAAHRATVQQATTCTNDSGEYSWVTVGGVSYYLGTPNTLVSGSAAILKPAENSSSLWVHCNSTVVPNQLLLVNRGLALTSRDTVPGGTVTLEPAGNGGNGYASQQWIYSGTNPFMFKNVKTGLYLRVRNGGPLMYQTVTTGNTPTSWNQS